MTLTVIIHTQQMISGPNADEQIEAAQTISSKHCRQALMPTCTHPRYHRHCCWALRPLDQVCLHGALSHLSSGF